jgi:NitT/TauT family transport system ATP-binding protein
MELAAKISIRGLSKSYQLRDGQRVNALQSINLEIAREEFVCVIGASGCGKTTLLRIIGGFEHADEGEVDIATSDSSAGPVTATVFQEDSVFPWLTAEGNVGYGLRIRGLPRKHRRLIVDDLIEKVGLKSFRHAYPAQLSGGMRQRVSVARAFANQPEVLLMDEPFGAVDEQTRLRLQDELLRLWAQHRQTVIFITHSLDEAITLSDRIVVLSARPGRIQAIIPVDIPRPRQVVSLRANPRYGELYQMLWNLLSGVTAAAPAE